MFVYKCPENQKIKKILAKGVYPVDKKSEIWQCYVIGSHWTLYLCILIHRNQYLKQQSLSTLNDMCLCHEIVQLFSMSCDWEIVKKNSSKPDQTGSNGKGVKQCVL